MENLFGNVITVYTRAEALEDGVLIDVTEMAKEAGFKVPVAVTSALWGKINNIPEEYYYQDVKGRLWDVLSTLYFLARRGKNTSLINYKIIMQHEVETDKGKIIKREIKLKAVIGPGDNFEPVMTIMLPNED